MNNNQIALYIGGTKQRQAGYTDLVILGLFPETEFNNMDRVTLISEKPVLIVKHTSDYILYQLVDRKVKSFDADANGVLCIATAISADMQFAAGKSPYTLLKEVYDKFRSSFMNPCSDGRDSFLDIETDNSVFQQIVSQYSLERRRGRNVVMTGSLTGQLAVPQEKIEAFFRDTQYPEFSAFKDIEIGTMCQSSQGIEQLEIPRPASYDVYVNDKLVQSSLYKVYDVVTTNIPDCENISFTIADLEAAPDNIITVGKSEARLDKANGRIVCRIVRKEIIYRCQIILIGSTENKNIVKKAIEEGEIRIHESVAHFDIMQYRVDALSFDISSGVLKSYEFVLDSDSYKDLQLSINTERHSLTQSIDIHLTVKEAEPAVIPVNKGGNGSNKSRKAKGSEHRLNAAEETHKINEAKFRRETAEREAALNKEWEKRLRNGRLISLLIGISSTLALCALAFCVYYFFFDKEPELGKNAKEKIFKEMLTDDKKEEIFKEMLTKDKEEEIFNGFINKDGFYESKAAKMIADEYQKKQKKPNNSNVKPEKVVEEAFDDSKQLKNEENKNKAKEKAIEEAKEEVKNPEEVKARAELLELVKEKKFNKFLEHKQMTDVLTMEERVAVENVLNYAKKNFKNSFKNISYNSSTSSTLKYAIKSEVYEKVFDGREITWDLLLSASRTIHKMIANLDQGVDIMNNVKPL